MKQEPEPLEESVLVELPRCVADAIEHVFCTFVDDAVEEFDSISSPEERADHVFVSLRTMNRWLWKAQQQFPKRWREPR